MHTLLNCPCATSPTHLRAHTPWRDAAYDLAVDARVDTTFHHRSRHFATTTATIAALHASAASCVAVFFPSYAYAETIARLLTAGFPLRIAVQPKLRDLAAQSAWVDESLAFADALFLVLGSSFAESIDSLGGRITHAMIDDGSGYPKMEGQKVFKHAIVKMPEVLTSVLKKTGLGTGDIKVFIPHQANLRIAETVQRSLGLRDDQVFNNIQKYGNTTAASIPLALSEAIPARDVKRGDLVALAAFGAGFTWAAALARW